MSPLGAEWVENAEMDYRVALRELASGDTVYDAICFHAQQCVEKYLKAYLQESRIVFPRTHDLAQLLALGANRIGELVPLAGELAGMTDYAVEPRYPGRSLTRETAEEAVRVMTDVRRIIRGVLQV